MIITRDIILKGPNWARAMNEFSKFFHDRPYYDIFFLCLSLGIRYDKICDEDGDETFTVPRTVIVNEEQKINKPINLEVLFQTAILTTKNIDLNQKERLSLAFGENTEFNKNKFLIQFANYGLSVLLETIGETESETMDNIIKLLNDAYDDNENGIDISEYSLTSLY